MLKKNKQIYLDFDGVICDSNFLKTQNIYTATLQILNANEAKRFTDYFTSMNGVPREKKTLEYFGNPIVVEQILAIYTQLNKNLINANITDGLIDFLIKHKENELIIISGGNKNEIITYLHKNKIINYFLKVLSGPKTKEENLKNFPIKYPALLIGDSYHDYEVATKFNLDFIFMYGATQEANWRNANFNNTKFTKDFINLKDVI